MVVFAITGALVASRKQMDTVGFMWMGVIIGVGGGTLRDLLLDAPVFWTVDRTPLALCLCAAGLVHFSARLVASRDSFLLCVDAFGMALLSTVGTAKVLDLGTSALVVSAWEVATAAAGGILRDILGQEPSILLRRDIYVSAAVFGSATFVLAAAVGAPGTAATALSFAVGFGLRAGAIRFDLFLPIFRSRPDRIPCHRGEVR